MTVRPESRLYLSKGASDIFFSDERASESTQMLMGRNGSESS